ncbi:MAG: hypothetical protein HOV81_02940 [Kofleriaceae bacterium]|nr:hypothetical protein [Kofleriaceae bacterium]
MKALLLLLVLAKAAHATGICENTERRYHAPTAYSESEHAFAVPGVQPWCEEVEDGGTLDEKRGEVAFVELRKNDGTVIATLTDSTDAHASFDHVDDLSAELARRGYKPVSAGRCTITSSFGRAPAVDGWPAQKLAIVQKARGKQIKRVSLGAIAKERKADAISVAHIDGAKLVVWTLVPTCGGPPPGYFGANDGGACYPIDTPVISVLDAKRCR